MSQLADVRSASAPWTGESRGLVDWVCTNNPFYVLSALLVCLGLRVSFGMQSNAGETWALLTGMAGYTLLLAVTACLLVRFVGVWDDVRTVLLIVVLMFLATSVTFDEVLARDPTRGIVCYFSGLVFAVALSEGILRSIGLKLPAYFRVPYYLILTLFFLYPVALTPLLNQPHGEALSWALFGFSPAAALVFLSLVPAIRQGRSYVHENGSPWGWAWYPWTLFGLLASAVMARSALLCWSMHHLAKGAAEPYIFGPYFLIPFALALGVLILEIGLVERRPGVLRVGLFVPIIMVALALIGHRPEVVYQSFLARFCERLGGNPLFLTLLASAGFYAYAAARRVSFAVEAFCGVLVVLAFVPPGTVASSWIATPRGWPILVAAVIQFATGLRMHSSWRCLLSAFGLVAALGIGLDGLVNSPYRLVMTFHLILLVSLIVGAVFDDMVAHALRNLGSIVALMACLAVIRLGPGISERLPGEVTLFYPLAILALLAGYGYGLRHPLTLCCAAIGVGCWLVAGVWKIYLLVRVLVLGLDYIVVGMVLFALAVATSAAKGKTLKIRAGSRDDELFEPPL